MIKGRFAGPLVVLLSVVGSCAIVWVAHMVGAARANGLQQDTQERRANTLTCEATTQYDLGPASRPMRGRRMRIAIPIDATTLSVKYGVRELQDGFEWTDCDKPGADCYPPGNAWFSDFDSRRAQDGQEFSATAWNGSRHSSRAFRILVVYNTSAGKCSSMTPSVVAQGTSEQLSGSIPTSGQLVGARIEIKDDGPGLPWQSCEWGKDCRSLGEFSFPPVARQTAPGSAFNVYQAVVSNGRSDRARTARLVLDYVP